MSRPRGYVTTLEQKELRMAATAGVDRRIENIYGSTRKKYGASWRDAEWDRDIDGCIGEIVVARFLNHYWSPGTWQSPDLRRKIEVRSTRYQDGCLLLHQDDIDDRPYVLVTIDLPRACIRGWAFGREGKLQQYWHQDARSPAFFVPQHVLRSTDSLLHFMDTNHAERTAVPNDDAAARLNEPTG